MPGEEQESGAPKVVKKVRKLKKEPALQPALAPERPAEAASASPAVEKFSQGPHSDIERLAPTTPVMGGTKGTGIARASASGGLKELASFPEPPKGAMAQAGTLWPPPPPSMEAPPAPGAPSRKTDELAMSFVPAAAQPPAATPPPPYRSQPAAGKAGDRRPGDDERLSGAEAGQGKIAPGPKSVESRIGSIDIDKLTSELEQDILNTLTSEIGEILAAPPPQTRERKEVRDDHASATQLPPRPPPARLPEPAQDRAMENEQRERRVAYRLGREFDKLPVNMRNELVKTLARTDDVKVREDVVIACASNFDKLPPEVRALLRTLANDRDSRVREEVAFELNRNFTKISPDYRNDLIPLLVKDVDVKVREDIVAAIASHFDKHAPEVQELLKTLASDRKPSVRDQVMHESLRNADKIPEAVRTELTRLLEKTAIEARERE